MPFCPKCGVEVKDEDSFCSKCGSSLKETEPKPEKPKKSKARLTGKNITIGILIVVIGLVMSGLIITGIFYFSSTSELPVGGVIQGAKEEVIKEAIKHINAPEINLNARVEKITSEGLSVTVQATVRNPNSVSIDIDDIEVKIKGATGETYTQTTVYGASIPMNGRHTFTKTITIPFTALSEYEVITTIQSRVGAAGSGTKIPVSSEVRTQIPRIDRLITLPRADLHVHPGIGWSGGYVDVDMTITNPNDFGISLGDINIEVTRPDGGIITHKTIDGGLISGDSTETFSGRITIGWKMAPCIIHDRGATVRVKTDVGLEGIADRVGPLEVEVTINDLPPPPRFLPSPFWC